MEVSKYLEIAESFIVEYGIKVVGAIAIWIIGSWIIKRVNRGIAKVMTKQNYDESLQKFLLNLIGWGLKILLFLAILSQLGVETTSFAAILAAAGLAIGMALQGSLGNFAGGVLIMIFKPIKIGDLVEAQGEIGVVKEIEIFTTKLTGLSNKEIIIPNGALSNGNIINYTSEGTRRVDLVFGVSYDADIKQSKEVMMNVLTSHPKVLKDPAPAVTVLELADSSVNFAVRPWCKTEDYWNVYFDVTENTKLALDKAGIEIPYPHQVEIQKKG
ncbi:mechanosensitive ion channel family protein [Seonamhaeicola aphaedonensis]|uniref:Small conductance mechanosensitive channel n=1 Tax=Seonamhaeicola aphaedonensis TaxID=1461338 RepID=A0A3D9HGU2_9FLAO|nr:mechanosensitive ion channel domain-containing protein [Seonamhaeicola aphaedonensis]RED48674.1 small conductance mechanosensitive channel [Seonamhaeicola aphaedonensis]